MQHLSRVVLTALPGACMPAICSCSVQPPPPAHGSIPLLPFSVVVSGDAAVDIGGASTFDWAPHLQQTVAEQPPEDVSMNTLLQAAISETLHAKGYRNSALPGAGDLVVGYHVAPAAALTGRESLNTNEARLQPGLSRNSPGPARYEKGTLVIELTDKSTGLAAWHSALQGFAVRDLDATGRWQRIGLMVDRMLAGVPAK
jgi:hypothetical protein